MRPRTPRTAALTAFAAALLALAGTALAQTGPQVDRTVRYGGADRVETAVLISRALYPTPAEEKPGRVVIARADQFPDSLAGSVLAGIQDAPILLVRPDELPVIVADELKRLDVEAAVILGGPAAVSAAVEAAVEEVLDGNARPAPGPSETETTS